MHIYIYVCKLYMYINYEKNKMATAQVVCVASDICKWICVYMYKCAYVYVYGNMYEYVRRYVCTVNIRVKYVYIYIYFVYIHVYFVYIHVYIYTYISGRVRMCYCKQQEKQNAHVRPSTSEQA